MAYLGSYQTGRVGNRSTRVFSMVAGVGSDYYHLALIVVDDTQVAERRHVVESREPERDTAGK